MSSQICACMNAKVNGSGLLWICDRSIRTLSTLQLSIDFLKMFISLLFSFSKSLSHFISQSIGAVLSLFLIHAQKGLGILILSQVVLNERQSHILGSTGNSGSPRNWQPQPVSHQINAMVVKNPTLLLGDVETHSPQQEQTNT